MTSPRKVWDLSLQMPEAESAENVNQHNMPLIQLVEHSFVHVKNPPESVTATAT